jgi:uncharacterized repeat protein (TIGR01451 family)
VSAPGRIYVLGGNASSGILDRGYYTPLLAFEKSASPAGPVSYGDTINYTLKLTNLGVRDFETLTITDTISTNVPALLAFHQTGDCPDYSGNTITCTVSNLTVGATAKPSFAVTFSESTPTALSPPALSQVPLAVSASPTRTWERPYSTARLEVVGVGISDTLTTPLRISNPDTIIGNIWVQAAFKIDAGEKLGGLNFYSGSVRYPLPGPTSVHSFIAVYERDVPVSDVITVSVNNPLDEEKARALTAYFLRRTREGHGLVGYTMCQSLYRDSYSDVLKLPLSVNSGDITVTAVIVDNKRVGPGLAGYEVVAS